MGPGGQARRCLRRAHLAAQACRQRAAPGQRRGATQVAHHAAHPGERRRDPPARRAVARRPGRHPGRAPQVRPLKIVPGALMDTLPMQLDAVAAAHGGLEDFRITSMPEMVKMLKSLVDGSVIVNLNGSEGTSYSTTLWSVDSAGGHISFSADADSNQVQAMVEAEEVVAVAYLDSIKLQFDVAGLVLVRGGKSC